MSSHERQEIAEEAARIMCVEQLVDYRSAKLKAAQRLGYSERGPLPDNATVQEAVIRYQQMFGGGEYHQHLRDMRQVAIDVMHLLAAFEPRLVGGAVTGAVSLANRVQLQISAESTEAVEIFLLNQRIRFQQDEREYRFSRGRSQQVPLIRLEHDGVGVDIAIFESDNRQGTPLNPADGKPYVRLDLAEAERLAAQSPPA